MTRAGASCPDCGNGFVDPNESCDPPQTDVCDATCHTVTCDPPAGSCGNGVVDSGEACEPPGVGACGWDCQTTPCAAPAAGEIGVACSTDASGSVAVGARSGDYLVGWTDVTYRPHPDVVARRLDGDGAPVDAIATVVSASLDCGASERQPSVGSNAAGYVVAWAGFGPAIRSRRRDVPGDVRAVVRRGRRARFTRGARARRPDRHVSVERRRSDLGCARAGRRCDDVRRDVALEWSVHFRTSVRRPRRRARRCRNDAAWEDRDERRLFPPPSPPAVLSASSATIATLGSASLAVWYAVLVNPSPPAMPFVAGAWLAANGTTSQFSMSSRVASTSSQIRPALRAAPRPSWSRGPTTRAAARPKSAACGSRPAAARSTRRRARARDHERRRRGGERPRGRVRRHRLARRVDRARHRRERSPRSRRRGRRDGARRRPRLLASGLGGAAPAIASAGDGRSLVVYVRPDAGRSAVRAQLVPGS